MGTGWSRYLFQNNNMKLLLITLLFTTFSAAAQPINIGLYLSNSAFDQTTSWNSFVKTLLPKLVGKAESISMYFPAGVYTGTFLIDGSAPAFSGKKINIQGDGHATKFTGNNDIIKIINLRNKYVTISRLDIELSSNTSIGINFNGGYKELSAVQDLNVDNVNFSVVVGMAGAIGIKAANMRESYITRCNFNGGQYNETLFTATDLYRVTNIFYTNCWFTNVGYGVKFIGDVDEHDISDPYNAGLVMNACFCIGCDYAVKASFLDWIDINGGLYDYNNHPFDLESIDCGKIAGVFMSSRERYGVIQPAIRIRSTTMRGDRSNRGINIIDNIINVHQISPITDEESILPSDAIVADNLVFSSIRNNTISFFSRHGIVINGINTTQIKDNKINISGSRYKVPGSGTVSVTANSDIVTGLIFTSLLAGDIIYIGATEVGKVLSTTNKMTLRLNTKSNLTRAGSVYKKSVGRALVVTNDDNSVIIADNSSDLPFVSTYSTVEKNNFSNSGTSNATDLQSAIKLINELRASVGELEAKLQALKP